MMTKTDYVLEVDDPDDIRKSDHLIEFCLRSEKVKFY
jgi:hypothetical protein